MRVERGGKNVPALSFGGGVLATAIAAQENEKIVVIISTVLPGTIDREIRPSFSFPV